MIGNSLPNHNETLLKHLLKAEALTDLALDDDFSKHSKVTIHNYLWTLRDLVYQARLISEKLL